MRAPAALFAFAALFHLTLPHALREGETAIVEVTLGRLTSREPIEIRTATGRLLGAVSTVGVPRDRDAGTYQVPVPKDAFVKGRLDLRLSRGKDRREPAREEVKGVKLTIRPS
jgi:hypothetical protein